MSTPPEDPPPAPVLTPAPEPPLTYQPATYYGTTVTCTTESCINYADVWEVSPLYSNGGIPQIVCGICGAAIRILTAELLDPQPIFD